MVRSSIVTVLCALFIAGCGKPQPRITREVPAEDNKGMSTFHGASAMPSPAAGHAVTDSRIDDPVVRLGRMSITAPETWVRKQPRSGFLLAEFSLPRAEGDPSDGRLTITAVGGSVQANVDRWRGQFGGSPEQDSQKRLDVAGISVTTVDLSGTYADRHGMMGPVEQRSSYRMRAAIFSIDGQQFIIKAYGPGKTMAQYEDDFLAFVKSLKPADPGSTEPEETKEAETYDPQPSQP